MVSDFGLGDSEDVWLRIGEAAVSAYGAIEEIIRVMTPVLNSQTVVDFCKSLGLCSAGFLFEDVVKHRTRFFSSRRTETYRIPYIWTQNALAEKWADLIHDLFVYVRDCQVTERAQVLARIQNEHMTAGDTDAWQRWFKVYREYFEADEEYLVCLPGVGDDAAGGYIGRDSSFRTRYCLHYCTTGETLFTTAIWRLLGFVRDQGRGLEPLSSLSISLEDKRVNNPSCVWRSRLLIPSPSMHTHGSSEQQFSTYKLLEAVWHDRISGNDTWKDEWKVLRLTHYTTDRPNFSYRNALLRFVHGIRAIPLNHNAKDISDYELNAVLVHAIPVALAQLGIDCANLCVNDAIEQLEKKARFPILPFFFWNLLDEGFKTYMVNPVWTSQAHSIKVIGKRECRHLGLALNAVVPLRKIDWTLPAALEDDIQPHVSNASPLMMMILLCRMSQPLVEHNIYHAWRDHALVEAFSDAIHDQHVVGD